MAIKGITFQFEYNKDLFTVLMRSLVHIFKCRQGPTESLTKHEQGFTAAMATFLVYGGGSLAFPVVCGREMDSQSLKKGNTSNDKMEAILTKVNSEALGRIFPDSLDDIR